MIRSVVLAVGSLLLSSVAVSQSPTCPEAETMQSLLTEVRQLRQDLQTVSVAARKAQILIYRLYIQEAIVQRVSENLNNTKTALDGMRMSREYQTEQIKRYEEAKESSDEPTYRKQMDDMIAHVKSRLEAGNSVEQEMQAKAMELEEELRSERAKLEQEQAKLDELDNALENSVLQAGRN
jgi:chromosome segregation ATPase